MNSSLDVTMVFVFLPKGGLKASPKTFGKVSQGTILNCLKKVDKTKSSKIKHAYLLLIILNIKIDYYRLCKIT